MAQRERQNNIKVVARQSAEPINFDAWADNYVHFLIAADRAAQHDAASGGAPVPASPAPPPSRDELST